MDSWYVLDESTMPAQPVGPYSYEQLRDLVTQGRVQPSTRIARVGGAAWTEAGLEPALVGLFRAAPPQVPELAFGAAASQPVGCMEFTFAGCVNQTIAVFKARWPQLLMISVISFAGYLVLSAPQLFGAIYDAANDLKEPSPVTLLGVCCSFILNVFIGFPFFYGCIYATLGATRGAANPADVLIGFRNYGTALLGSLFTFVVYMGAIMIAYIPLVIAIMASFALDFRAGAAPGDVGAIALIVGIPLFVSLLLVLSAKFAMRVLFVPIVAIDPVLGSMGVSRAINYTWSATKGCGWTMIWLLLCAGVLAAISFFLFCVGYFLVGLPLLMALMATMYETIYRRGAALPQAPATATA